MDHNLQLVGFPPKNRFIAEMLFVLALIMPGAAVAGPAAEVVDPGEVDMQAEDTIRIDIKEFTYQKGKVQVAPGTTIVWVNKDPVQHDVKLPVEQNDSLASMVKTALVGQDERIALRFNKEGSYLYICSIHPFMKGVVEVQPA